MATTIGDLILESVADDANAAAPKLGAKGLCQALEVGLSVGLPGNYGGEGLNILTRLVALLDMPVPRVLVDAWRQYEAFLPFAAAEGRPATSGSVDLFVHEYTAHWELAPRIAGKELSGPRLVVGLTFSIATGTVEVKEGRIVGLEAPSITCAGTLRIKDAPEELAHVGPTRIPLADGRFDFGRGWAIRPAW